MRFCEDKAADLERARAAVAEWREQNPASTQDQMTAALGAQFHPDRGPWSARCCSRSTSAPTLPDARELATDASRTRGPSGQCLPASRGAGRT